MTLYGVVTLKGSFIDLQNTCKSSKRLNIISEKSTIV